MESGSAIIRDEPSGRFPRPPLARRDPLLDPCTPAELRELRFAEFGGDEADACETFLTLSSRMAAGLELAIGDGFAALTIGDRLISLGYSNLGDYAREELGIGERAAQNMAQLSRGLRSRLLLRGSVLAGEVPPRAALTVLPVARGDDEAAWLARAKDETVRALEKAVRKLRAGGVEEEEWTRFRVSLSPADRAIVDEALAVAGKALPGSKRAQRLEAMAQEYLGEHPLEAGDDGGCGAGKSFRADGDRKDRLERYQARLEEESDRWSYLPRVPGVTAPDLAWDAMFTEEIDRELRELAAIRDRWDDLLGWASYALRRSGLWKTLGFASFEHYCTERLGLAPRTVEQRADLEKRIWEVPALDAARDEGLSYEKVRALSRLPDREIEAWVLKARAMTVIDLRWAIEDRDETQMRAARTLRTRVPMRIAVTLAAAFRAVRAAEGRLLEDGKCLVVLAKHFLAVWKPQEKKAKTLSQKIRERDLGRCQAPGCSRWAVHSHHIVPRSQGGTDDPWNLVALCGCHHLRGIHGGWMRVRGRAPDGLEWKVRGREFRAGAEGDPTAATSPPSASAG
jgi:HNH endonuclease